MKMRKSKYLLVFLVLIIFSIYSCGRKISPSVSSGKPEENYDVAAFSQFYVEAIKQKLLNNTGDALKYLEQCIKINPESDAAYYQMAQILIANGDLSNGKRYAAKALSIEPENNWYIKMLAGLYYQEQNLDSAIFYYEMAVKYFPDKEDIKLTLGNLYAENKDFERANELFESLDKKFGVNEKSTVAAIQNLLAAKKYDEAQKKAMILIKEYPDEILYNGLLAEIYRGQGELEKAIEVYNQLIRSHPDDPQTQLALCDFLINEKSYDELFLLLNTVVMNGEITREDKISLMAKLIEQPDIVKDQGNKLMVSLMVLEANYKNDNIIPLLVPELLIKQEDFVEASLRLEEIIKASPDNYYAWEKLLLVYLQLGDYNKLMVKGEECATRFNRSFLAKILYANGALENSKYSVALEELRKAEILAGNNQDLINQVLTIRADVYYRMKDYNKSFEVFEQAIKSNNDDLTVLNNYAYYLAEQNMKLKEAEEMAKKVIETDKNNTTFLDTYAWVLYKRGKIKEAARIMETIVNSGEKPDAEWFEHYGFILKKQRKCAEAVEKWTTALKLDSSKENLRKEIQDCKR
jgi:tetratricopeptide (TPR) repeat protein